QGREAARTFLAQNTDTADAIEQVIRNTTVAGQLNVEAD
ncbi:MAG: DNA recombination/repair protein RecA, partial [Dehalococcoidia bacterium]